MKMLKLLGGLTIVTTITACGGSNTSGNNVANYASQLASLNALDTTMISAEANLPTGSATYTGIANMSVASSTSSLNAFIGELNVEVNFATDSLSGSVENFANYTGASVTMSVPGSVAITNGVLTGNNTGIGDGLTADADGTIDGHNVDMDVTGHFFSSNGDGLALYFDGASTGELGVGLATR